jgi:hypothetical protein
MRQPPRASPAVSWADAGAGAAAAVAGSAGTATVRRIAGRGHDEFDLGVQRGHARLVHGLLVLGRAQHLAHQVA